MHKIILLIGFKHTGKSVIGKLLAQRLQLNFIDLDKEIEREFNENHNKNTEKLTCRNIMQVYGELYFRGLEKKIFSQIFKNTNNAIISTGGGTVIHNYNQSLIAHQKAVVIHITADPEQVYQRIMAGGRPAFFSKTNEKECFEDLWKKREKIYQKLSDFCVTNNTAPEEAVNKIFKYIKTNQAHQLFKNSQVKNHEK